MRSLLIIGTFFIWAPGAWGQDFIANRSFPHSYGEELKVVSIYNFHDTLFLLTYDSTKAFCDVKRPGYAWYDRFNFIHNTSIPGRLRYSINQSGHSYIYASQNGRLYYNFPGWPYDPEWRLCPGKPIIDSLENLHVIWHGTSSYYYGFSQDTLSSFAQIDTFQLPSSSYYFVSSPDNSKIALLCLDQSRTTIYKYITDAGLPLDFSSYTQIAIDPAYSYLKDITLDYAGNIYFVATHDGYPPYTHYMHYAWSEQYGYRYLDMNDDDVLASTNFELSFGPNNEIIIIESMDYYYQNGSNFFATTDAGNTWLTVLNDQYSNSVIHGTAPRTFSDKIDFIYIAPGSIPWSMTGLFYIPIPRDSIFNNLTAVDGGEALLPEEILLSNYPNPFNPQTTISFSLAKAGRARLAIYDISGRLVATLLDSYLESGSRSIIWNAADRAGKTLSSGIFFARLEDANSSNNRRLIFLK